MLLGKSNLWKGEGSLEICQLVKKAKQGNDDAFNELISNIQEKLYVTAYSYVNNKEDALDIVSEGVCRAYTSINKLKDEKLFNTWITRIIINLSIDVYKKNKRVVNLEEMGEDKNEEQGISTEEILDLNKAVEILEPKYKIILQLKYYNGLTLAEIAEALEMPLGTVKTNLNKALKILRVELREESLAWWMIIK